MTHDGDFHYFAESPAAELAAFVDCYWGVRGSLGVLGYHMESVLPSGSVELMVNFGSRQRVVAYGERGVDEEFDTAWLSGMQDQRLVHCAEGWSDHISIRFRPGGAHAFLDVPLDEVTNRVVVLEDLIGSDADTLRDELAAVSDDRARCRILDRWLIGRRRGVHPYYHTARRAADLLRGGARGLGVSEVCDRLGLSNRYLIRQFRATIGLTPKTFARVERFRGVVLELRDVDDPAWARTAARHGYADQSHLIREFRRFALLTPTEFLERRTPDRANVVADDEHAPRADRRAG